MCRLACFAPGFGRDKAIEILRNFESGNTHGIGFAYITKDKKFHVEKVPCSLSDWLSSESKDKFLAHMPYDGWTIAHLRWKTHGAQTPENTHPFVVNDWCVVHNGVFSEQKHYRKIITKFPNPDKSLRKLQGDCDSEVAAQLLDIYGPEEFTEEIDTSGVFIGLHRSGKLHVMKTSGEISGYDRSNGTTILASSFSGIKRYSDKSYNLKGGCWIYGPDGKYLEGKEKQLYGWQNGGASYQYQHGHHSSNSTRNNGGVSCGSACSTPTQNTPMTAEERAEFAQYGMYGES